MLHWRVHSIIYEEFFIQLRRYLNEVLLDQLPCLTDLQRFLEHLAVMEPPMTKRDLVIEQVWCNLTLYFVVCS